MRLFWKVFAVLWIATLLVGGSGFLVSRALQQDWLLLQFHPQLRDFSEQLIDTYEEQGPAAAQRWLESQRQEHRLRAQLYDDQGISLLTGTLPSLPRFETSLPGQQPPARFRHGRVFQLAWTSDIADYQLTLNIPAPELFRWQRTPFALIANITLAMAVLAMISLALSRYLTAPLRRLGQAAQELAKGRFDARTLEHIGQRRDEIGELSRRFQSMGERVQSLLDSQRQLMRDISHELRSPLARMRIALAIGSKQELRPDDPLWQRLDKECTRVDRLIDDILTLSRLDTQDLPAEQFDLDQMVSDVVEDARFAAHGQQTLEIDGHTQATLRGWREQLSAALDNLLRNALRFSPADGVIRVRLETTAHSYRIRVEDQGPGVSDEWISQLGEPFVRVPDQPADSGHGLGLAIARRAVARHAGTLSFSSTESGGFAAVIELDKSQPS
ncbi:HAMP domain-containing sensor histidine kinase [Pseudomonas saliphila]|uniref:HAMP domain-containing sensor histidine kinase n=1 Tax=Pseudomonas saliphila TaxID=2586906 RepID=UPI00123B7219|nr:HAMP domain-containing sensor histidine kinase [Pseudomonas saliphila]